MKSRGQGGFYKDEWWFEHVEGEHEPSLRQDLDVLIRNSVIDREIAESLLRTKRAIREADDVALPESGLFYQNLHDRIMSSIEDEPSERLIGPGSEFEDTRQSEIGLLSRLRVIIPSVFTSSLMAIALVVAAGLALRSGSPAQRHETQEPGTAENTPHESEMLLASLDLPREYSRTTLGFESDEDFMQSAVAEKLGRLDPSEVEEIYRQLRQ